MGAMRSAVIRAVAWVLIGTAAAVTLTGALIAAAADAGTVGGGAAAPGAPSGSDPEATRGKYLAAAGNCVSCHTPPGGAPFAGGLGFVTPFGTIYSSNITPDPDTGIGRWTAADLRRAMHEGVGPGGYHLFPAFPYPSFTQVTDDDVDAIYAYLRTLTPVHQRPPANGLLFRVRWGMAIWNRLFFKPGRFQSDAAQSPEWNRGAYLVDGLGHCDACHTPRNLLMGEVASQAYAGGNFTDRVIDDKVRRWSAVNLTSSHAGLAAWSLDNLATYLRTGFAATRAGTFGPMNDVIVNSLSKLTPQDLHAMAVYLKSLPARDVSSGAVSADAAKAGAGLYADHCEECHASSGRGGLFKAPPLAGSAVVQSADPASLINIILYGPNQPKQVSFGAWETMKPYREVLSDSEVAAVANYVRASFGNRAAPVAAADVAKQR